MRYYELTMTRPGASKPFRTWTTHPNGVQDPGALMIEFDLVMLPFATPVGGSTITVWGTGMQDLVQSQTYGMHYDDSGDLQPGVMMELKAGMAKGLPLANHAQAGTLMYSMVKESFGTWQGTSMHVDFVLLPQVHTHDVPGNIVLNWKRGQKLSDALRQCLSVAYPDKTIKVDISDQIVADQDMPGAYGTLETLAQDIKDSTRGQYLGKAYRGVDIVIHGNSVIAYDQTVTGSAVQLNIADLLSQPTWVKAGTLQIDVVLRGDIQINDFVIMPPNFVNTPGMVRMAKDTMPGMYDYQATFQGAFRVVGMRHVGNSRSPDATLWATHLLCIPDKLPTKG